MILTKLGLGEDTRFIRGIPQELRSNGSTVSLKNVLEVVQDEHGGIVIPAHVDQKDGLLERASNRHDYQLPKLLAVEVTAVSEGHREILEGRNREWGRFGRPPAVVMSSDAKSLKFNKESGQPEANCLGYRYTWVKMSNPSIEALRQGFLDQAARIQPKGGCPSEAYVHPRIKAVSVSDARFLSDLSICFSENLNCVIGGRGSGKSTLLEYLRFALTDGPEVSAGDDPLLQRKKEQIRASLGKEGKVCVEFETAPGLTDVLVYQPGLESAVRRLEGRNVVDLATVLKQLRASFFSQGELSRMSSGPAGQAHVLEILDAAASAELQRLNGEEADLKAQLASAFQARRDLEETHRQVGVVQQELQELDRMLQARQSVREDSRRNQGASECIQFVDSALKSASLDEANLLDAASALQIPVASESTQYWPKSDWLEDRVSALNRARSVLGTEVSAAVEKFRGTVQAVLGEDAMSILRDEVVRVSNAFEAACQQKGLHKDDIAKLTDLMDERRGKEAQRDKLLERIREHTATASCIDKLLGRLHSVWREQFATREATGRALQPSLSQMARIRTSYMGDTEAFKAQWDRLAPRDGRGKLGRRWDEIGADLYSTWERRGTEESPWETIELSASDTHLLPFLYGEMMEDLQPKMWRHLQSPDVRAIWEDVRCTRIGDGIDVDLLAPDGQPIGSMNGTLSEGQRNTVLLNLLLARGDGPIVIDQPEDELDSSFIYKNLVEDFRKVKTRRQLIVATHNANLPVNGDAELVVAMGVANGRGQICVSGGLDQQPVVDAVLDIMEGSEQAFRRRSEKYHF